jgi:hypothetical protein
MVEYAWHRHLQRTREIESLAHERALARATRERPSTRVSPGRIRRGIGYGLMRIGARIAAEAGA